MAIVIEANYSKKLGLPAYSSHSYSVTIRSEVADLAQVERESARLYAMLQGSVDREMREPGFVPEASGNGSAASRPTDGHPNGDQWSCSDKQRDLILKIVSENQLHIEQAEQLAKSLFGQPLRSLNRLQASGLIEDLIQQYGPSKPNGNGSRSYAGGARR